VGPARTGNKNPLTGGGKKNNLGVGQKTKTVILIGPAGSGKIPFLHKGQKKNPSKRERGCGTAKRATNGEGGACHVLSANRMTRSDILEECLWGGVREKMAPEKKMAPVSVTRNSSGLRVGGGGGGEGKLSKQTV